MPKSGAAKEKTGAPFSKIVLKLFGLKYISGLSLARSLSKSVSQKARKCSVRIVLQYFEDLFCKSKLERSLWRLCTA